jgi:hypothetical protein
MIFGAPKSAIAFEWRCMNQPINARSACISED